MLTLKRMTSFVLAASLLAAPAAFAAGKAGKGKADIPAAQSFTFTAHAGEKSSLVGPGSASLELPLKPGGYLDTASPDVIKDLGLISFRTNEPAFTKVKLHMLAPPRMERVGDPTHSLDYELAWSPTGNCADPGLSYTAPGSLGDQEVGLVSLVGNVHLCAKIVGPVEPTPILTGDYTANFTASVISHW